MDLNEYVKKEINMLIIEQTKNINTPKPQKSFLYHGSNIKNLKDIQNYGLLPDFGETVKSTEAYQYYMDDDYINPEDRVDGVIFFSDNPNVWTYSNFGNKPNIEDALLVIVKKNNTIFRKLGNHIYNINNKSVDSVNYIDIDKMPLFIENRDYFSFDEQEPYDILYGERLQLFLKHFL